MTKSWVVPKSFDPLRYYQFVSLVLQSPVQSSWLCNFPALVSTSHLPLWRTRLIAPSTDQPRPIKSTQLVAVERGKYLKDNKPIAPSSAGRPDEFSKRQQDPKKRVECNRPPSAAARIPATLLHPVFGEFLDTCNSGKVTADDHRFALDLSQAMSVFYDSEKARAEAVRGIFEQHGLSFIRTKIGSQLYETDGDISTNGHRYIICEVKNEIGSSGAEPYNQAIVYYQEATRRHAVLLAHSPLPCLIVLIFGLSKLFSLSSMR